MDYPGYGILQARELEWVAISYSRGSKVSQIDFLVSKCIWKLPLNYTVAYWVCGLEEAQAGIKIAGRNINSLRCADDTTLMAESDLLIKMK